MIAEKQSLTRFLEQIARMETADEIRQVSEAKNQLMERVTAEEALQIRDAVRKRNNELIELSKRQTEESLLILTQHGFVVDTSEWLTIKRYAERYDLTTQVVTNWIARGVIPTDCTMTLPELNDLRLVRDQPYR